MQVKHPLSNASHNTWMNSTWRPAMAWMYMVVCIFDFILFPIFWSVMQVIHNGNVTSQWNPLTLIGAGLFHMAMGTVLGVTAWGRTREKINNASIESNETDLSAEPMTENNKTR